MRVLVVDDDIVSRELLILLLRRQGYSVDGTDSGERALDLLKSARVSPPNIVLADLQMPGITGTELAGALRHVCGNGTTLLAMSGSPPIGTASQGYDDFLLKPFTMETFTAVVTRGRSTQPSKPVHSHVTVLDEATYEKLSQSMKPEKLKSLYHLCLGDAKQRIAAMRQAAAAGDNASYKREAHAIKGGCGMVGAMELQSLATAMENKGLAANHVATLDEFLLACERLEVMLNARENASITTSTRGSSGEAAHE
ncbi:response regulator [Edaphobacter bradus]|uniref:response regulator n=1 Tax=Edaphobacter bradus TaxID=2259016 RepID=UPI0021E0FBBE|nr:response regulator [Edaphobacter bradus]